METWNGSSWSITPSPNQGTDSFFDDVSCADATHCVAVGNYVIGSVFYTLVETLSDGAWTITPSPNQGTEGSFLNGVSCVDASHCTAVGYFQGTPTQTSVETWNGSSWSIIPSPNQGTDYSFLHGVSCVDAAHCTAVGLFIQGPVEQTLVETWNGSSWNVFPSPNQGIADDVLFGITCVDASHCVAIGWYDTGGLATAQHTLVENLPGPGGTWIIRPSPSPGNQDPGSALFGIACPDVVHCVATGFFFNRTAIQTLVLSGSVSGTLQDTTPSLPAGTQGASYSATLMASGGTPPYSWKLVSASGARAQLPVGLHLNASTGVISGRATRRGTYFFGIRVTDSATPTPGKDTVVLSIQIN